MSKSNHQKHGFVVRTEGSRRDKFWITAKKLFREYKKRAIWNGRPVVLGELGHIEQVRFIEIGGQF